MVSRTQEQCSCNYFLSMHSFFYCLFQTSTAFPTNPNSITNLFNKLYLFLLLLQQQCQFQQQNEDDGFPSIPQDSDSSEAEEEEIYM